jgi:hypothetical protein
MTLKTNIILSTLLFFLACSDNSENVDREVLVARIGDKSISVNEFIRRAEYTIRPVYCRSDNYVHRKIVLNSLIAEKLFALEAGEDNELLQNHDVQLYLRGRKEQAMRQWMYYDEMHRKVHVDSSEIKRTFKVAGRTYAVSYYNVGTINGREQIYQKLAAENADFTEIYRSLGGQGDPPDRKIGFQDPEHDAVHDALFNEKHEKGDIVGPVIISKDNIILLRINGWTDQIAMTDDQIRDRWQTVKNKIAEKKSKCPV